MEGKQFRKADTSPGVRREGEVAVQSSVYTGFLLVQEKVAQVRDPAMRWGGAPGAVTCLGAGSSLDLKRHDSLHVSRQCLGPWEGEELDPRVQALGPHVPATCGVTGGCLDGAPHP